MDRKMDYHNKKERKIMAKEDINISKVEVKIGDTKVELTLKQVIALRDVLNETFPKEVLKDWVPIPYPIYPIPYWQPWYITYSGGTHIPGDVWDSSGNDYQSSGPNNQIRYTMSLSLEG